MTYTFRSKKVARTALLATLIIAFSLVALLAEAFSPSYFDNNLWISFLLVSFSIFTVSYFLPESRTKEFASRQSAVAGGCLFLYLTLEDIFEHNSLLDKGITVILAALVSYLSYYIILSIIRHTKARKNG